MTQPGPITIPLSHFRMLRTLVVSGLLMVAGIFGIAYGLVGMGDWVIFACAGIGVLAVANYLIAAIRQRPRVVITADGFVFDKLFGGDSHQWGDIDGRFVVIQVGMNELVAFKLTEEYKARTGKKPTSLYSGYDAVVGTPTLACSAGELAGLLNEHKDHQAGVSRASSTPSDPGNDETRPGPT